MFSKVALSTLAVGAISANALAVPIARSPAPQPESWSEWGTNVGNYYANKYGSPDQVSGLPRPWLNNKREPSPPTQVKKPTPTQVKVPSAANDNSYALAAKREPETWGQWGKAIGNYTAAPWKNSKREPEPSPEPETWEEWGTNIGNYYANQYGSPSDVPGLPQFKRSPETWGQWGTNIGNYYANKYGSPDQVSGLPRPWLNDKREPTPSTEVKKPNPPAPTVRPWHYAKREPESWEEWGTNIGNYYANQYGSPSDVPGLPQFKRSPETWEEWGTNIGNYYANQYGSPSDVPGLPQFKREPSPEPETWEEWGTNIGNYYSNKYSTPDSVPGLPHY